MAAGGQNPHRWIFPPKAASKSAPGGSWCSKRGVGAGGSSLERPPHGSLAPIEPKSARFWFRKPKSRPVPTLPNKEGVIEPTPPDPFLPGGGGRQQSPPLTFSSLAESRNQNLTWRCPAVTKNPSSEKATAVTLQDTLLDATRVPFCSGKTTEPSAGPQKKKPKKTKERAAGGKNRLAPHFGGI